MKKMTVMACSVAFASQSLLLVEDEPMIRELFSMVLRSAGYAVTEVGSADDAIEFLDDSAHQVRGIVSDIRLGGPVSGWDVVRRARALNPDIAAIYISADSGHEWQRERVPDGRFLQKPFTPNELLAEMKSVLTPPRDVRKTARLAPEMAPVADTAAAVSLLQPIHSK